MSLLVALNYLTRISHNSGLLMCVCILTLVFIFTLTVQTKSLTENTVDLELLLVSISIHVNQRDFMRKSKNRATGKQKESF